MAGRKGSSRAARGSPWRIQINNLQDFVEVDKALLRRMIRRVLESEGLPQGRVSVAIVDDDEMARLNQRFAGRAEATDVLAFPYASEKDAGEELGEVVVSAETAKRRSAGYRNTPEREVALYIIHGILHLAGYNDGSPERVRQMRRRQGELIRLCGPGLEAGK